MTLLDNLTKPLGLSGRKGPAKAAGNRDPLWVRVPYMWISGGILSSVFLTMLIWVAAVNDPKGGEPVVHARIVEPKFDSKDRDVGLVAVSKPALLEPLAAPEGSALTEVFSQAEIGPIDPDEIRIYDPTKQPEETGEISLSAVADKELLEKSRYGFLPKVGENGEKPAVVYSRPSGAITAGKSQIVLIVDGLGLNEETTQSALADLPPETTLAFAPYAGGLFNWMARARGRGHELLLQLPLEPFDYPNNDPGPKTLLVDEAWDANIDRLHWLLSRMTNYVGVVNYMGARFSASPEALRPLFNELRSRGLLYVDNGSTPLSRASEIAGETKISYAQSSIVLDSLLNAEDIDARLIELESLAREKGIAVGIASAFPVTIKRLKRWSKDAERRGIKLIPVSAALNKSGS